MQVLNIAPEAQWIRFDDDLSLQVRRITVHDAHDIVAGTALARVFSGAGEDGDVTMKDRELLDLCDRIFEKMVMGWTVQAPDGSSVEVEQSAWRWLITDEPRLISWLLNAVLLGVARDEAEVSLEKGD